MNQKEKTIKNLIGMEVSEDKNDFYNDVICAFVDNEEDIIIEEASRVGVSNADFVAYEDNEDSERIFICIDENKIVYAW